MKVREQKSKANQEKELREGESIHSNGKYQFRWTDEEGKRHSIYAPTIDDLREKEQEVLKKLHTQLRPEVNNITINEMFARWKDIKRGIKDNTLQNYIYMYKQFVEPSFGKRKLCSVLKSDVKRFYNSLVDEKSLSLSTVDGIHGILHQIFEIAADDLFIRRNPTDNVMKELKRIRSLKAEKKRALTKAEQDLFLNYLKSSEQYQHWYPIFAVMLGTGMRVGELIGLRWCDINLEEGIIDVNHTLVYYKHAINGCYYNVHSPKTECSIRKIPMLESVKEAIMEERLHQFREGIRCKAFIDGYTDFIFINRFGNPHNQGTLNKAIRRIVRDCNDEVLAQGKKKSVLLPYFSCHTLRHTFTTRLCEAGVNVKAIQDLLGHADISTTLNIYADATKEMKVKELKRFEDLLASEKSV